MPICDELLAQLRANVQFTFRTTSTALAHTQPEALTRGERTAHLFLHDKLAILVRDGLLDLVLIAEADTGYGRASTKFLVDLTSHIKDAVKIAHYRAMQSTSFLDANRCAALATKTGALLEVQPGFFETLSSAIPLQELGTLPIKLLEATESTSLHDKNFYYSSIPGENTQLIKIWRKSKFDLLTKREMQCAVAVGNGVKLSEIAAVLGVTHSTVSTHTRRAIEKLDLKNQNDLRQLASKAAHIINLP